MKPYTFAVLIDKAGTRGEPFDMSRSAGSPTTRTRTTSSTSCSTAAPSAAKNNINTSYFDVPAYQRKMDAAARLTGDARYRAYGTLDIDITRNQSPLVDLRQPERARVHLVEGGLRDVLARVGRAQPRDALSEAVRLPMSGAGSGVGAARACALAPGSSRRSASGVRTVASIREQADVVPPAGYGRRMRRTLGASQGESLATWAMWAVVLGMILVTYWRLPPDTRAATDDLYHVSGNGLAGGLSRVLVELNFPMALVAIVVVLVAVDSLPRSAWALAAPAIALSAVVAWPGVVDQDDLDARVVNAFPRSAWRSRSA